MAEITRENLIEISRKATEVGTHQDQTGAALTMTIGILLIDIRERLDELIEFQTPNVKTPDEVFRNEGFLVKSADKAK